MTRPDGEETASPLFYLNDQEHSVEQVELLATVIATALARNRVG